MPEYADDAGALWNKTRKDGSAITTAKGGRVMQGHIVIDGERRPVVAFVTSKDDLAANPKRPVLKLKWDTPREEAPSYDPVPSDDDIPF